MPPVISITLPSLYPDALGRSLRNIDRMTRCEYQVIVVSPFDPQRDICRGELIWVQENTQLGISAAHSAAIERATGEFVTAWADDHLYAGGWDIVALQNFKDRELAFHRLSPGVFELGLRHVYPDHIGTEFGIYYPYFPFMRLSDVAKVGGWLSGEYRHGFSDSDLALRVWSSGGRCEWSESVIIAHIDDMRKHGVVCNDNDMRLFTSCWGPRYGAGWDMSHLRGFNLDFVPEQFPGVLDDSRRSVYRNDPKFRAEVGFE